MTIESVKDLVFRLVGRRHADDDMGVIQSDPISKERIEEMQRDIHAKLGKEPKFTPAGPAGW